MDRSCLIGGKRPVRPGSSLRNRPRSGWAAAAV